MSRAFDWLHTPGASIPTGETAGEATPAPGAEEAPTPDPEPAQEEEVTDPAAVAEGEPQKDAEGDPASGDETTKPQGDPEPGEKKTDEEPAAPADASAKDAKPNDGDEIRLPEKDDDPLTLKEATKEIRTNYSTMRDAVVRHGSVENLIARAEAAATFISPTAPLEDRAEALKTLAPTAFNAVFKHLLDANKDIVLAEHLGEGITAEDIQAFKESRSAAPAGEADDELTGIPEIDAELRYAPDVIRKKLLEDHKALRAKEQQKPEGEKQDATTAADTDTKEINGLMTQFIDSVNTPVSETLSDLGLYPAEGDTEEVLLEKEILRVGITNVIDQRLWADSAFSALVKDAWGYIEQKDIEAAKKNYATQIKNLLGTETSKVAAVGGRMRATKAQAEQVRVTKPLGGRKEIKADAGGGETSPKKDLERQPAFSRERMKARLAEMQQRDSASV